MEFLKKKKKFKSIGQQKTKGWIYDDERKSICIRKFRNVAASATVKQSTYTHTHTHMHVAYIAFEYLVKSPGGPHRLSADDLKSNGRT